jgi:hypothetical protein
MIVGVHSLEGLRDVRQPRAARLQIHGSTCGLYAVASVLADMNPAGTPLQFAGVREWIRANRITGRGVGLQSYELGALLNTNVSKDVAVLIERYVTEVRLLRFLERGHVIAHVDGNHWVRLLEAVDEVGLPWIRIYDPARGNYEQILSSLMIRTGHDNQMIWVRP